MPGAAIGAPLVALGVGGALVVSLSVVLSVALPLVPPVALPPAALGATVQRCLALPLQLERGARRGRYGQCLSPAASRCARAAACIASVSFGISISTSPGGGSDLLGHLVHEPSSCRLQGGRM